MKKLKTAGLVVGCLAPTTTLIVLSLNKRVKNYEFDGSSSMRDLMVALLSSKNKHNQIADGYVSSRGSLSGLRKLMKGDVDFAVISHDMSTFFNDAQKTEYINIEIAQEGIGILYIKPKNCKEDLIIKRDNIDKIYSWFFGHKKNESITDNLKSVMGDVEDCSAIISTFSKTGGVKVSGTSHSFLYGNGFNDYFKQDQEWFKKLANDSYGQDFNVIQTRESSNNSFTRFYKNQKPGYMIYLPGSFIKTNIEKIKEAGISVAKFQADSAEAKSVMEDGYAWTRKISVVVKRGGEDESKKKEFLKSILDQKTIIESFNFTPLTIKWDEKWVVNPPKKP